MPEPLRHNGTAAPGAALDRDAQIEQLLLRGLDHYFARQYDQAIHVWTRVLFLDRTHAQARAYIERARCADAERHRESDALLQQGLAAFARGEASGARQLLESAMQGGAPTDEALALLERLNRLDPAARPEMPRRALVKDRGRVPGADAGRSVRSIRVVSSVLGMLVALATIAAWQAGSRHVAAGASSALTSVELAALPRPSRAENLVTQARALVATGHLHDALRALRGVRATDPLKPEADRLVADIQRQLIGLAVTSGDAPQVGGSGPR